MSRKTQFYSLEPIKSKHAKYNIIFGERSNGKTFAVLRDALVDYFDSNGTHILAILRRHAENFIGAQSARTMYEMLENDGNNENQIEKLSKGEFSGVEYYGGQFFLTKRDKDGLNYKTDKVIAKAFALTKKADYKGGSWPNIKTILFDEFIEPANSSYLRDEWISFTSVLSSIIRQRDDIKIYMCGNTVNNYCPYFAEMGLYRVSKMEQGTIDIYTYTHPGLLVAVEYADSPSKKGKPSDVYFAFDNPKLQMITKGEWEFDIYPHCPAKILPKDIKFIYFIKFNGELLQCEIIKQGRNAYTYIHRKTSSIKDTDKDLIYSTEYDPRPNHRRDLTNPTRRVDRMILRFFDEQKVFYQDNSVGNTVTNYFSWCRREA